MQFETIEVTNRTIIYPLNNVPEDYSQWQNIYICVLNIVYILTILIFLEEQLWSFMFFLLVLTVTFPVIYIKCVKNGMISQDHMNVEESAVIYQYLFKFTIGFAAVKIIIRTKKEIIHFLKQILRCVNHILLPISFANVLFNVFKIIYKFTTAPQISAIQICEDHFSCFAFNYSNICVYCGIITFTTYIYYGDRDPLSIFKDTLNRSVVFVILIFFIGYIDFKSKNLHEYTTITYFLEYNSLQYFIPLVVDKITNSFSNKVVKCKCATLSVIFVGLLGLIAAQILEMFTLDFVDTYSTYLFAFNMFLLTLSAIMFMFLFWNTPNTNVYSLYISREDIVSLTDYLILGGSFLFCICACLVQLNCFCYLCVSKGTNNTFFTLCIAPVWGIEGIRTLCLCIVMSISTIDSLLQETSNVIDEMSYCITIFVDLLKIISKVCFITSGQFILQPDSLQAVIKTPLEIKTLFISVQNRRKELNRINSFETASAEMITNIQDKCAICLLGMNSAIITPCGHYFHRYCCKKNGLYGHKSCPVCRHVM